MWKMAYTQNDSIEGSMDLTLRRMLKLTHLGASPGLWQSWISTVALFWCSDATVVHVVSSGIVTSSQMFSSGYGGAVFAGILMLIIGLMFGALAALDFFMLLRVSTYSTVSKDFSCNIWH